MAIMLITGANGFVGSHLAQLARAEGHQVASLDRAGPEPVELLDIEAVRRFVGHARPDYVFHLAGALRAPDFRTLYESNVVGTANLLDALVAAKLSPRTVIASSSAVYGSPLTDGLLTEECELRPLTHYAASKMAQEAVAKRAFIADQLPVMVARSFNVVGPGQPSSLAAGAFAEQVAVAERDGASEIKVGDLSSVRDFVDVRDVARGLLAVCQHGKAGATYNLASGRGVTLQTCVDTLISFASRPMRAVYDSSRARANDARAQLGDSTRTTRDTGWAPTIPFEQSMRDLLGSCRSTLQTRGGTT